MCSPRALPRWTRQEEKRKRSLSSEYSWMAVAGPLKADVPGRPAGGTGRRQQIAGDAQAAAVKRFGVGFPLDHSNGGCSMNR
jgi:hypothetical protein